MKAEDKIALVIWLVANIATSIWAWLESTSLDFDFRRRYPEEGDKIEPAYKRMFKGYYFLGNASRKFLEEKNDKAFLVRRKRIICLIAALFIIYFGGFIVVGLVALFFE